MQNGRFPAAIVDFPRRPWNLLVVIVWNILLAVPLIYGIKYAIASRSYIMFAALAMLFGSGKCSETNNIQLE